MYQYFSKKDALLHAVLQQHLSEIGAAVEASVPRYREQPLAVIADGIVGDYLNVKIANIDISRALYRILPDLDAPALQAVLATKIEAALYELLASAADVTFQDLKNIISVLRILLVSGASDSAGEYGPNCGRRRCKPKQNGAPKVGIGDNDLRLFESFNLRFLIDSRGETLGVVLWHNAILLRFLGALTH